MHVNVYFDLIVF